MGVSAFPRPSERRRSASPVEPPASGTSADAPLALSWLRPLVPLVMLVAVGLFGWGQFTAHRQTGAGLVTIPVLCVIALPLIRRLAREEQSYDLAALAWFALGVKFCATYFRLLGGVDSVSYDNEGARLAEHFRDFDFTAPTGRSIPGTGTIRYTTGLVHVITNSSYTATFLVFSFAAFCGLLLFVRAFSLGTPGGNRRRYAVLVLLWPTLLYWPSSIGKEALMIFGLGLLSLGAARLLVRRPHGIVGALGGLIVIGMVRPHVALIAITAMLVGVVFRAPVGASMSAGAAKVVCIGILLVAGGIVAGATADFLELEDLSGTGSVNEALNQAEAQTAQGGGEFAAARVNSPVDYPWAFITVLFRPFLVEVSDLLGAFSAVESMALAALGVLSLVRFLRHLGRIRQSAYLAYAITFVFTFCYLFSAIANFGILTRQRSQVLPFVMVCLALPQYVAEVRRPDEDEDLGGGRPALRLARSR